MIRQENGVVNPTTQGAKRKCDETGPREGRQRTPARSGTIRAENKDNADRASSRESTNRGPDTRKPVPGPTRHCGGKITSRKRSNERTAAGNGETQKEKNPRASMGL